jgi:hypothetical protein
VAITETTAPRETCAPGPTLDPATAASPDARSALDLHEGIDDPRANGCPRWPEHYGLLNEQTGEFRPGRCKATNLCAYCARLFAVETSELLLLDAMEDAPQLYVVLTARELLDRASCRRHLAQIRKALRKRWPAIRWAVLVEFQRRGALHLNLLVKGVPVSALDELHEAISAAWCRRVDALPRGQFVGEVSDGAGLVRYISLHFLKPGQAPPRGWNGHRVSYTRDYLVRPASVMREEARASLRVKRALWRGATLEEAELELAVAPTWSLRRLPGMPLGRDHDRERRAAARAPFVRASPAPSEQGASISACADVTTGSKRTTTGYGGTAAERYPPKPARVDRRELSSPPGDVRCLDVERGIGAGSPPRVASP